MREDEVFTAAIEMLGRAGAENVQIRYHDDEQPVVWLAVANFADGRFDAAAAPQPHGAVIRLCEQLIDGGTCTHCGLPTSFEPDFESTPLPFVCSYQYDPETKTFRRSCADGVS